ncbi:MAG: group 1 glycosyl transferase [Deltaproteobacteria bacterium CG11_big_fil_rev_8_21_14_0_20_47_16]|nr:MAG: group 1 glycosyl transferase [Deltaproteobacteria bacterium CG11_big_fil_rev_8_21_14_0_20_47_16]
MIDVCLLLEGSYPYVAGGVSTWVHQLIGAMKDIRFGIVYITPHSDPTREFKYTLPNNVIYLKELCLHDYALDVVAPRRPKKSDYETLIGFYENVLQGRYDGFEDVVPLFQGHNACFDFKSFFESKSIWASLIKNYQQYASDTAFLDFFWTWRGTQLPLLQVVMTEVPRAPIVHAISTGYAGLLGAVAKIAYGNQFFLTEHGIYTHERMLEIAQATWIYERERMGYRAEQHMSVFKQWWLGIFKVMGSLAYRHVDRIFTLYEGNRLREILEGANPEKITIIPNGIDVASYESIERERKPVPQIGFVGRIVRIKDAKTFIQAARLVLDQIPDAEFYLIGPTDEEEDYVEECELMIEAQHMESKIKLVGRSDVKEYYKFLDLVVLTSISEAQPYVILEAGASGIPVVASDVGACREMLEGRDPEDIAIGPGGIVTEVSNAESTAEAIVKLLSDRVLQKRCSEAARIRVHRYYNQDDLLSRYLNCYEQGM